MKTALCTLVVGERFEQLFDQFSAASWRDYCQAHGYELFVFRKPFSPLAGKSLAWQKLFLLDQPELEIFEKIVWLDADIIIRRNAPPLEVPAGRIGYVPETPFTGSVESWYAMFNLPPAPGIVQTGLLCLEHSHQPILRQALAYPETGMYEMPALSWCISHSGLGHHLDRRLDRDQQASQRNALAIALSAAAPGHPGYLPPELVPARRRRETGSFEGEPFPCPARSSF